MQRCQKTSDWYSPDCGCFHRRLVAKDRTVKGVWLLRVRRTSASLPKNPTRVTRLIENMFVSPCAPDFCGAPGSRAEPLPREPKCILGGTKRDSGEAKGRTNRQA